MRHQPKIRGYWLLLLLFIFALPIQAKQNATEPVSDLFSKQIGEYISNIKPWEKDKLWLTMYALYRYVQKSHPETIEYLENNADKNANFAYILAFLEDKNYWDTNRNIFTYYGDKCLEYNDKTIHFLRTAAQQEHASALYELGSIAFCENDIDQYFEYRRRAFYAGYYGAALNNKTFQEIYPQHIAEMDAYAKSISKGDFFQFDELRYFYSYERGDKKTAQYFYKLAKEKLPDSSKYRLISFDSPHSKKVICSEEGINSYRQSILAGNMQALKNLIYRCETKAAAQKVVTEGLQHIEQQVKARILAWQKGHMDYKGLFNHITIVRRLAEFYSSYYYGMKDLQKADYYYQHLVQLGNTFIFNDLGDMWLINLYEKSDYSIAPSFKESCQKAHDYFVQGSQHNHPHSIRNLAIFYLNDTCVPKDEEKSAFYQEKLAKLADNSVRAASDLYHLTHQLQDMSYFSQAKKYAQQLADYGDISAMPLLAQLWLIDQDGLEIDEQKAQLWYEKTFAIMKNNPPILGRQYLDASKDFRKAGFNETADTYLQQAIALIGDEEVQKILQREQAK